MANVHVGFVSWLQSTARLVGVEVLEVPNYFGRYTGPIMGYYRGNQIVELEMPADLMWRAESIAMVYYRHELEQVGRWFGAVRAPVWC